MKKIFIALAIASTLGFASSCQKCNTCTGTTISEYDHDYCNDIYRTKKTMDEAKTICEENGGTWSAK